MPSSLQQKILQNKLKIFSIQNRDSLLWNVMSENNLLPEKTWTKENESNIQFCTELRIHIYAQN